MERHKGHRSFPNGAKKRKKAHERNKEHNKIVAKTRLISDNINITKML